MWRLSRWVRPNPRLQLAGATSQQNVEFGTTGLIART